MEKGNLSLSVDLIQYYLHGKKSNSFCLAKNIYNNGSVDQLKDETCQSPKMVLPKQIEIKESTIPGEQQGVFSTMWIREGTQMGPYTGRVIPVNEPSSQHLSDFTWEIMDVRGRIKHFIDGKEDIHQNWLCYVRCARFDREQNLDIVQLDEKIYYRVIKDIPPHQELLVWYGFTMNQFLGIPISSDCDMAVISQKEHEAVSGLIRNTMLATLPGRLRCTVCHRGFNSRSNLRSHMRIHTLEKPFQCKYCKKSFSQSSTLRNHTRLHTGEKPYNCNVCDMAYSQLAGLRAHQKSARHKPMSLSTLETPLIQRKCDPHQLHSEWRLMQDGCIDTTVM